MSIKETLERFDEKFVQITYPFLGGMRLFWNTTPDEKRIDEMQKIDDIKQFIIEEIKLAVEEIVKSRNAENTYSVNTFEAGYKAKEFEIQWNLNKYFEV
jgi:hypothetical protein